MTACTRRCPCSSRDAAAPCSPCAPSTCATCDATRVSPCSPAPNRPLPAWWRGADGDWSCTTCCRASRSLPRPAARWRRGSSSSARSARSSHCSSTTWTTSSSFRSPRSSPRPMGRRLRMASPPTACSCSTCAAGLRSTRTRETVTMPWTLSRRIALGFALGIVLLLVVAGVAMWALTASRRDFTRALDARRNELEPTLRFESELRSTNVELLRALIEPNAGYDERTDSTLRVAQQLLARVRARADHDTRWDEVPALLGTWAAASRRANAAARRGYAVTMVSTRRNEVQPARAVLEARLSDIAGRVAARTDSLATNGDATANRAFTELVLGALLAL